MHRLSPVLTLQGAVAHCDMPVESGPTLFLPYSQTYLPGYLALKRPEFRTYFEENHVQLPLEKGDVVFFNPALFHAAAATGLPGSSVWPIFCRYPPLSAGRWKRWIANTCASCSFRL